MPIFRKISCLDNIFWSHLLRQELQKQAVFLCRSYGNYTYHVTKVIYVIYVIRICALGFSAYCVKLRLDKW